MELSELSEIIKQRRKMIRQSIEYTHANRNTASNYHIENNNNFQLPSISNDYIDAHAIDTLDDLNILSGSVLKNKYIVIISYRNQSKHLSRCLDSLSKNLRRHDVGIIVIDDNSTDNSISVIKSHKIYKTRSFCLVANNERKYLARNLYNAIHLLVDNDESIIIQLDGDDELNNKYDTFKIIGNYYSDNVTLQTFGGYVCKLGNSNKYKQPTMHTNMNDVFDFSSCHSYSHIKTYKKRLFTQLDSNLLIERDSNNWIKSGDDNVIHPNLMRIAGTASVKCISEPLYIYNVSESGHDVTNPQVLIYNAFKLRSRAHSYMYQFLISKYKTYENCIDNGMNDAKNFLSNIKLFNPSNSSENDLNVPKCIDNGEYLYDISGGIRDEKYVALVIYRNQSKKIIRCLESIIYHPRNDVGILIIDDCSDDGSIDIVNDFIISRNLNNVTFVKTKQSYGKTCNYVKSHYEFIDDNSVVVLVDGDDYLNSYNINVFSTLDKYYDDGMLATYGMYQSDNNGIIQSISRINMNFTQPWDSLQCDSWIHLKTYKNKIFKQIPEIVFKENDDDSAWLLWGEDTFANSYIIEMTYPKVAYIKDILYIYDISGDSHWFDEKLKVFAYTALKCRRERYNNKINNTIRQLYTNWSDFLIDYNNNKLPNSLKMLH